MHIHLFVVILSELGRKGPVGSRGKLSAFRHPEARTRRSHTGERQVPQF